MLFFDGVLCSGVSCLYSKSRLLEVDFRKLEFLDLGVIVKHEHDALKSLLLKALVFSTFEEFQIYRQYL